MPTSIQCTSLYSIGLRCDLAAVFFALQHGAHHAKSIKVNPKIMILSVESTEMISTTIFNVHVVEIVGGKNGLTWLHIESFECGEGALFLATENRCHENMAQFIFVLQHNCLFFGATEWDVVQPKKQKLHSQS